MTKNKKPKKFETQSTPQEVYQQETFYQIIVEDDSGIVEDRKLLEPMFEALKNHRLTKFVSRKFSKNSKLDVEVNVDRNGRSTIAKVSIHKKTFREKFLEGIDSIGTRISDRLNQKSSK